MASYEELLNLEERMGIVNRGATTEIIERNTLPHKYKKLKVVVEDRPSASSSSVAGDGATAGPSTSNASGER